MPPTAKWPPLRLASTLRSLMSSQSGNQERETSPDESSSSQPSLQPPSSDDKDLDSDSRKAVLALVMKHRKASASHGTDDPSNSDDGQASADADANFGELEMFDSNATPQAYSSQLIAAPTPPASARQAPEAIMSEDLPALPVSKSSKRDRKHKKKRKQSHDLEALPPENDKEARKKHRRERRSAAREATPVDRQPENGLGADRDSHQGTLLSAAKKAKLDGSRGHDAPSAELADGGPNDFVTRSPDAKKKRKHTDSTESKRRKKRRPHGDHSKGDDYHASAKSEPASRRFLRLSNERAASRKRDGEEQDSHSSDSGSQKSPSSLHPHRRSPVGESRGGESNDSSATDSDQMQIDPTNDSHAEVVAAGAAGTDADPEAELLSGEDLDEPGGTTHPGRTSSASPLPLTDPSSTAQRRTRSLRPKKAKPTYFEQAPVHDSLDVADAGQGEALAELPSPAAMTPKPRNRTKTATRSKKKEKLSQSMRGDVDDEDGDVPKKRNRLIGYTQGRFTDEELARIARAVEAFRSENNLSQQIVNQMIHASGGTTAGDGHAQLWTQIFAECPDRHRQKIINITRKKFHNFVARGTWTPEQDAELTALIQVHGTKWAKIASIVNRHPEDLRDRFRNYLVCGSNKRNDAWDEGEEARLTQYVLDAMEAIDEMRIRQPSRDLLERSYEELIDWQMISERMDRTRSRLQCITKWKSLNIRLRGKDKLESTEPDAQISFRLERARLQIAAMPEAEQLRLLVAIQATDVSLDSRIPWQKLVDKQFRNKWHRLTQMLLWQRLKQTVPDWEAQSTRNCAQYLINQYEQTGELPRVNSSAYDEMDNAREMDFVQRLPTLFVGPIGKGAVRGSYAKSAEFVTELDDGQEEAADGGGNQEMMVEDDIKIDPALTLVGPPRNTTSAIRTGFGRPPELHRESRGGETLMDDPQENNEEPTPDGYDGPERVEPETVKGPLRMKRTPRKHQSPGAGAKSLRRPSPPDADSDSNMEDMEDLPARLSE